MHQEVKNSNELNDRKEILCGVQLYMVYLTKKKDMKGKGEVKWEKKKEKERVHSNKKTQFNSV